MNVRDEFIFSSSNQQTTTHLHINEIPGRAQLKRKHKSTTDLPPHNISAPFSVVYETTPSPSRSRYLPGSADVLQAHIVLGAIC